ncbi:MAG: hypothetical protein QGF94_05800, partial [Candidatus Thalassarchaeaceae archaeon]|nr:hypothetical protein [Candidatus Thalassarchaeaceae archaeon]
VLKKPKKKQKKRSIVRPSDEPVAEVSVEAEDELSPEDDPNYKVDENGCEWWYDQGAWWYRTPDMEEWTEYDS